jgi:hypothetical protein
MAYWLKTDGTISEVKPASGESFSLEELQGMVGGYIQMVRTHTGDWLVCDEDGISKRLPFNEQATERYRYGSHDTIRGNVVIATYKELENGK